MNKKKRLQSNHSPQSLKTSERDYSSDFVFEDAERHNAPIIARIKEFDNKYLNYLLTIHNPLFYIYQGTERLNSGESEELFFFTYYNGNMIYTFVENVNPGKATFVIHTSITDKTDGRNYNYLISQVKSYFRSNIINKRSKLFSFELRPFSGYHLGYDRLSHVDFDRWKQLLRSKFYLHKPNYTDISPAKTLVCSPLSTIKTQERITSARLERKNIRYIRVGDPTLLIKGKIVLISHEINSNVSFKVSSFIRANGGKIAASNRSDYDIAMVSSKDFLEKSGSILYEIAQKVRLHHIPVVIVGDFLKKI